MTEQKAPPEKAPVTPRAFGDWFLVQPAIPKQETSDGRVVIPDNVKDTMLWYGLVVATPEGGNPMAISVGDAIYFNRSAAIEKVPHLDWQGVPEGLGYIAVHRSTIMLHWKVEGFARERLLNPPATPPDHEWAKQMKSRIELQ